MGRLAHGIKAKIPASFDNVVNALWMIDEASNLYGEVYPTTPRTALFFGEKYFLRAGSSLGIAVFVIEASGYTVVKMFSTGGKRGLLDFTDLGASKSYIDGVLENLTKRLGVKPIDTTEVSYLSRDRATPLTGL